MDFPVAVLSRSSRVMFPFLVFMLTISVMHPWLCIGNCKVEAIRMLRDSEWADYENMTTMNVYHHKKKMEEKKHKFFNGKSFGFNETERSFEEIKRTVPACPDPLHNK
ncbi:unnamed protein product [Ilex paraguariensis]|uniref:Uncharacterized protein n=1 Tax=Ilex paraguariensis TaxID=185542 RepID=A0ABC8QTN1_9AQUA